MYICVRWNNLINLSICFKTIILCCLFYAILFPWKLFVVCNVFCKRWICFCSFVLHFLLQRVLYFLLRYTKGEQKASWQPSQQFQTKFIEDKKHMLIPRERQAEGPQPSQPRPAYLVGLFWQVSRSFLTYVYRGRAEGPQPSQPRHRESMPGPSVPIYLRI